MFPEGKLKTCPQGTQTHKPEEMALDPLARFRILPFACTIESASAKRAKLHSCPTGSQVQNPSALINCPGVNAPGLFISARWFGSPSFAKRILKSCPAGSQVQGILPFARTTESASARLHSCPAASQSSQRMRANSKLLKNRPEFAPPIRANSQAAESFFDLSSRHHLPALVNDQSIVLACMIGPESSQVLARAAARQAGSTDPHPSCGCGSLSRRQGEGGSAHYASVASE